MLLAEDSASLQVRHGASHGPNECQTPPSRPLAKGSLYRQLRIMASDHGYIGRACGCCNGGPGVTQEAVITLGGPVSSRLSGCIKLAGILCRTNVNALLLHSVVAKSEIGIVGHHLAHRTELHAVTGRRKDWISGFASERKGCCGVIKVVGCCGIKDIHTHQLVYECSLDAVRVSTALTRCKQGLQNLESFTHSPNQLVFAKALTLHGIIRFELFQGLSFRALRGRKLISLLLPGLELSGTRLSISAPFLCL